MVAITAYSQALFSPLSHLAIARRIDVLFRVPHDPYSLSSLFIARDFQDLIDLVLRNLLSGHIPILACVMHHISQMYLTMQLYPQLM
ncbi:hypothetical protein FIBSPDRAFT_227443 [Athelia psychrophila]|uniref:Uncharacterized protein n=1 Tax=Athelia psychrophila TaxID=1759441 RepID=A0A165YSS4_9AGAM|nr:hypothetical protein FIBSPDRAFT_227443 [Fibularhizoctonia sp. CBS 109695]